MEKPDGSNQSAEAARAGDPPDVAIHLQEAASHGLQASPPPSYQALGIGEYLQAYDSMRNIFSEDGVMCGSFQKLLSDANAGVLDCNVEGKAGLHCGLIASVQPAHIVACDSQNIDGYSAGEECNDDNSLVANFDSDLEDTPGYKKSPVHLFLGWTPLFHFWLHVWKMTERGLRLVTLKNISQEMLT